MGADQAVRPGLRPSLLRGVPGVAAWRPAQLFRIVDSVFGDLVHSSAENHCVTLRFVDTLCQDTAGELAGSGAASPENGERRTACLRSGHIG